MFNDAVQTLILMEPDEAHSDSCRAHKDPSKCNCYLLENAKKRVTALEQAGWTNLRRHNYANVS